MEIADSELIVVRDAFRWVNRCVIDMLATGVEQMYQAAGATRNPHIDEIRERWGLSPGAGGA